MARKKEKLVVHERLLSFAWRLVQNSQHLVRLGFTLPSV